MPPKIQPIDIDAAQVIRQPIRTDSAAKPVLKSRLKRLFDRPFPSVLRISLAEKPNGGAAATEFEPSSVCLAKMVQSFIEESNEKQSAVAAKCGRNRCNCFNGSNNDSSDDEFDVFEGFAESATTGSSGDAIDSLKGLVPCATVAERNLLADAAEIVEKNKHQKRKDDLKMILVDTLSNLGYDSSICKSKWDKTSSFPAGEYEYIDVIVEGERLLIDIDFRSEFEIARSTGSYKAILQSLPYIFVGKSDRLAQIVAIVSDAARQSLKKKGMHIAPWRKPEYILAKWLSPYTRATPHGGVDESAPETNGADAYKATESEGGELELIFGEESPPLSDEKSGDSKTSAAASVDSEAAAVMWQPPALKPKSVDKGAKIVTGLASLLREKP